VNDHQLIQRMLALDLEGTIERALHDRSACSAGGALAAMSFARERGVSGGSLLQYMTSYEVSPASSFVGYAGILYSCPV
jgi:AmmeMemoRadiSam system protein B